RTAVVAGTATAVSGKVSQKQADKQAEKEAGQTAAGSSEHSEGGLIDELERLGSLKTQGLLTDEEFAAAKAKLLAWESLSTSQVT
ncbi:MAG: SHOCT domain-containing protein, partial [Pontimonas sp.]